MSAETNDIPTDREPSQRVSRLGGRPLSAYVTLVMILPLIGLAVLGRHVVATSDAAVRSARGIESGIEVQSAAINVLAPLQVERTALIGLARIDEIGIDRDIALSFVGVDFEAIQVENTAALDAEFDALSSALRAEGGRANADAADRLDVLRVDLARARSASDRQEPIVVSVTTTMDELVGLVGELFEQNQLALGELVGGNEAAVLVDHARVAGDLGRTASDQMTVIVDAVLTGGQVDGDDLVAARIAHERALAAADNFDGWDLTELSSSHASLDPVPDEILSGWEGGSFDPILVGEMAQLLIQQIGYTEEVGAFSVATGDDTTEQASAMAADADRTRVLTIAGVVAAALVSVVAGVFLIRSFARPLAQLRVEAEEISQGALRTETLPTRGPVDVRRVTAAVNEMAGTLTLLDEHMRALASGESVDDASLDRLPGEVGATMRESVRRVTELTSRLQASEARLVELARHDHLTGLPNRFAVLEHLEAALAEPESAQLGVLFVDVDGFKSVNDTHGHAVGDRVLREVGHRMRRVLRDEDFIARLGGDEFIVVARHRGGRDALTKLGERLIQQIEQPYAAEDGWFAVSASVGVAEIEAGDDAMRTIERADAAVYHAKQRGRRRVEVFDADLQDSIEHQSAIELALRHAIVDGELEIHLQPIGALQTGEIAGAEALVRWNRPDVGLVPPGEFIPVAERSGLIVELERWVLHEACGVLAHWRTLDPSCTFRLAVNISGRHLIEGDLIANVTEALDVSGADPSMLEIELTESKLLDDIGRACAVLDDLRLLGIKVAIDDFGTGYSSMTYLRRLPVDTVKIDRSFIAAVTENGFDSTIVEAIVTIAQTLGLDIVAEGVETIGQLAYVAKRGVTTAQGYLLARPMPAANATERMFSGPIIDIETLSPLDPSAGDARKGTVTTAVN